MRKFIFIVFSFALFACAPYEQELIKAKDAHNYVGKTVTIIGKINAIAGPGYLTSTEYYLVTEGTEVGIEVTIPMEVMIKLKWLFKNQEGKMMKVTGLVQLNGEPYTKVKTASDVEILK